MAKNPPTKGTQVRSLDPEDSLEKEMATHSSSLASENPMDGGTWQVTSPWGSQKSLI